MGKIGFGVQNESSNDKTTKVNHDENYEHIIRFFGAPIIRITKAHKIETQTTEDN